MLNFRNVIIALFLLLMLPNVSYSQGAVFVVTENVSEKKFHDQITLVGRTEPLIQSRIVSEISGQVENIDASEGTVIKKGQPLISIDREYLYLNLQAKEAEAMQAEEQAKLAKSQQKRADELRKQNLISESAIDSANAWANIQQARFLQLDAERQQMQLDYNKAVIIAPYTGYTGRKLINVGEWVTPGMPVYEMFDLSKIKIKADLPERFYNQLKIGSEVFINVDDGTTNTLKGFVTGISPNASSETHTFPVIIEVDNANSNLGGGMLVKTVLSLNKEFESLSIPKDALIRQGSQTMVYTINDGKAAPIPVTIKSTSGEFLAVESPMLQKGMPVVVRGNERIYPGAAVTTGEEQSKPKSESTGQES